MSAEEEIPEGFKRCGGATGKKGCGRVLPFAAFNKDAGGKDGRGAHCKDCKRARDAKCRTKYLANPAILEGVKRCGGKWGKKGCGRVLPVAAFKKETWRRDGLGAHCRDCKRRAEAEHYLAHPGSDRAKAAKRYADSPGCARAQLAGYLDRRSKAGGDWPCPEYAAVYAAYDGLCVYCLVFGVRTVVDPDADPDHILALTRGGSNYPWNLIPACPACNTSKHARTPAEWGGLNAHRLAAGLPLSTGTIEEAFSKLYERHPYRNDPRRGPYEVEHAFEEANYVGQELEGEDDAYMGQRLRREGRAISAGPEVT